MKKSFSYVLRLALTLLAITAIMAAALAGVNQLTADKIAGITGQRTQQALQEVLTVSYEGIVEVPFTDDTGLVKRVYRTHNGHISQDCYCIHAYAVEVAVAGFDGEISMMVGVDLNLRVTGVSIISHTETAGLGAVAAADNAKGQSFRDQFIHMSGPLSVTRDGGEVDAISGATVTSRAVCKGINAALACVENLRRGVQQ